ncbi:MAG: hypothetical protein OXM59_05675 [Gammaproteobacteria bacterium]|nr:hypothetical protein [Gammaproteobacteria bacterium]
MTLLDELRSLEPGKPGQWSRRVSVTLACAVLVLVTAVGLQVRVRGKLLPQLAGTAETLSDLEERLKEARRAERQTRLLRMELEKLEEQLRQTGLRMPSGAESLDLAVSLAADWTGSPVEEVRPWQPAGETSRRFPHVGAEMQMSGDYGEIIGAINLVLTAGELRELVEFTIESGHSPGDGRLRAQARLLAYFAGERYADGLFDIGAGAPAAAQAPPSRMDLLSPFAALPREIGNVAAARGGQEQNSPRRSGFIRVGDRRYRIADDPEGRPRLHPETP